MLKQVLILKNQETGEIVERDSMDHTFHNGKRVWSLHRRIVTNLSQVTEFDAKGTVVKRTKRTPQTASIGHLKPVKPLKFDPIRIAGHRRIQEEIVAWEKANKAVKKKSEEDDIYGSDW